VIGRTPITFRQCKDALSKSPATAHGLAGHGCTASAKRGVVFSWVLLFWTSKREVPRPPVADESPRQASNVPNGIDSEEGAGLQLSLE